MLSKLSLCFLELRLNTDKIINILRFWIIILFKVKNSQWWYFAWENTWRFLLYLHFVVDVLYFIFDFHFVVICRLSLFIFCFSTSALTLPWTIDRILDPFYTFSPAHPRVIRDTFNFYHSVIFLPRALRFWVDVFHPQAFFTLRSFTNIWHNLLLSRPP